MSAQIERIKTAVDESLCDDTKPWTKVFEILEVKTGLPRFYAFIGGAVIVLVYLVFGYGANLLCHFIGVAYPAYVSIHAIETSSKEDDTRWLVYWVTFAVLTLVEQFGSILTSLIPFYFLLKCLFLIWCMLPIENNGSNVIYVRFVRPYFMAHHEAADKLIEEMAEKAKGVISNVIKSD